MQWCIIRTHLYDHEVPLLRQSGTLVVGLGCAAARCVQGWMTSGSHVGAKFLSLATCDLQLDSEGALWIAVAAFKAIQAKDMFYLTLEV